MARSPIMQTMKKAQEMVTYVRDQLSLAEYDVFLDMIAPLPEPETVAKKPKKRTRKGSGSKSPRAQSLASAIKGTSGDVTVALTGVEARGEVGQLGVTIQEDGVLSSGGNRCIAIHNNKPCDLLPDNNVHHKITDVDYHKFQPPAAASSAGGG